MIGRTDKCCVVASAVMAQLMLLSCAGTSKPAEPLARHGTTEAPSDSKEYDTVVTLAGRTAGIGPLPEATARFRGTGTWLGADSAYSVDLHQGRVLWLFGDTFIDPSRDGSRTNGPNQFVRNSVGIQTSVNLAEGPIDKSNDYHLSTSAVRFFTGPARDGAPTSFFPETPEGDWFWPLSGIRLFEAGPLLLFRMRVHKVSSGFGFAVTGWDAVAVDDPSGDPDRWVLRTLDGQSTGAERLVGTSVMQHGDYLYLYAAKNADDDHTIFLARISLATLHRLSHDVLRDPEWYTAQGFQRLSDGAIPAPVLAGGQIEMSVSYVPRLQRFVEIQTRGLFASDPQTAIVARTSERPEGPWSDPVPIWVPITPPGVDPHKLLTYAAKAHPEQRDADLVLTYMQNDVSSPTPSDAVYYPEVLWLRFP